MAIDYATSELNFDKQNWLAEDGSTKAFLLSDRVSTVLKS